MILDIASHTIADADPWCEPFEVRPLTFHHSQVPQIQESEIGYFVPVDYFTTNLGSFSTPEVLTSTLPIDKSLSIGSYPLSIFRMRRYSTIGRATCFSHSRSERVSSTLSQAISPLVCHDEKKVHFTLTIFV